MRKILFIFLLATSSNVLADLLIFGGDGHKEFLGCLSCNAYSSNSIWNSMSTYGWENGYGKWNPFGPYKNPFSSTSACNEYASDPPVLVDENGNFYGKLTIGEFISNSICGYGGNVNICTALKAMCAKN